MSPSARRKGDWDVPFRILSTATLRNVLACLQPTPAIPKVETHLRVAEAPVADAGRHDRLRSAELDHG